MQEPACLTRICPYAQHGCCCSFLADMAQGASAKLGKVSAPVTPRAAALMAQAAANSDAIASIQLHRSPSTTNRAPSFNSSPTKAYASLGRNASGSWPAAGAGNEPVRILLGLPAEDAEAVLEQFQEQVCLPLVLCSARLPGDRAWGHALGQLRPSTLVKCGTEHSAGCVIQAT